jgi:dTDP-4-amino-4,6-dideoxygalactose transaminase
VPIPFNRPTLAGMELDYIRDAIARGQLAGDGAYTERCQVWLRERIGAGAVLLRTHAPRRSRWRRSSSTSAPATRS